VFHKQEGFLFNSGFKKVENMIQIDISEKAKQKILDLLSTNSNRYPRLVFNGLG